MLQILKFTGKLILNFLDFFSFVVNLDIILMFFDGGDNFALPFHDKLSNLVAIVAM